MSSNTLGNYKINSQGHKRNSFGINNLQNTPMNTILGAYQSVVFTPTSGPIKTIHNCQRERRFKNILFLVLLLLLILRTREEHSVV